MLLSDSLASLRSAATAFARPLGHTSWLGTLHRVETTASVAALTFDDGPDPDATPQLLDLLDIHGARATFFVVGASAARHPALTRQIYDRGHAIGNHTWSHPSLRALSRANRRAELQRCAAHLAPYGTRLFRAPWGDVSLSTRLDLLLQGYRPVGWDVQVQDWLAVPAAELAARLARRVRPGSIALLHDALYRTQGEPGLAPTRTAMLDGLDAYLSRTPNLTFVTVPDLLAAGQPVYHRSGW
jgi:peptidoglycan/xylan/chitin deacetylase (PgdA/CDA1 family)